MSSAQPFVKWAGGKRQLLKYIYDLMPKKYNNYFEPFIGGGAVLFNIQPSCAFINDINAALINTYTQIKYNHIELIVSIDQYDNEIASRNLKDGSAKIFFYEVREAFNQKLTNEIYDINAAAMLIWLNKHCFNGLYRCNSKGLFNVPFANTLRKSYDVENILAVSKMLKKVDISCGDFSNLCDKADKGDFVFLDSPYAPVKEDSFVDYTKEGFSKEDHIRLSNKFKELSDRGCYCMLTNHNTELINELYYGFNKKVVQVKRLINRDANNRVGEEIIITNY